MNKTNISIVGLLSGDQFVTIVKALAFGTVVLLLAYGAYNSGYELQLSKDGLKLSPKEKITYKMLSSIDYAPILK